MATRRPAPSPWLYIAAIATIGATACISDDDVPAVDAGSASDAAITADAAARPDATTTVHPDAAADAGILPDDATAAPDDATAAPDDATAAPDDATAAPEDASTDAGTTDQGPRSWVVTPVGQTDTDFAIVIRAGADGPRIAHDMEEGQLVFTSSTTGAWLPDNLVVDEQLSCVAGCNMFLSMALDPAGRSHIAYRFLPPNPNDRMYGSIIRYAIVDNNAVLATLNLDTVPEPPVNDRDIIEESTPGLALAADGTAHIVYRATAESLSALRMVTVSGGVAGTPVTIPSSTTTRQLAFQVGHGSLVGGIDANGTLTVFAEPLMAGSTVRALRRVGGAWQAALPLPIAGPVVASAMAADGTVHVVGRGAIGSELAYATISPAGVVTARTSMVMMTGCGYMEAGAARLSLAIDSGGGPALVCAPHGGTGGIRFVRYTGGAWSAPELIPYPMGREMEAEGVSPALAFDPSGTPHVAFQGWHNRLPDLFYATYR